MRWSWRMRKRRRRRRSWWQMNWIETIEVWATLMLDSSIDLANGWDEWRRERCMMNHRQFSREEKPLQLLIIIIVYNVGFCSSYHGWKFNCAIVFFFSRSDLWRQDLGNFYIGSILIFAQLCSSIAEKVSQQHSSNNNYVWEEECLHTLFEIRSGGFLCRCIV